MINQVVRGIQVENGRGSRHVEMFAEWCNNFYEKGMGGDPHLMFPAIGEAWGDKWTDYMEHLLEIREELGLGDLFPPDDVVKEVQTIFEATGFKERLAAVRGEAADAGRAEPGRGLSRASATRTAPVGRRRTQRAGRDDVPAGPRAVRLRRRPLRRRAAGAAQAACDRGGCMNPATMRNTPSTTR